MTSWYLLHTNPSEKRSTLKEKFAPKGSKFFPFRVDPFSEVGKINLTVVVPEIISIPLKVTPYPIVPSIPLKITPYPTVPSIPLKVTPYPTVPSIPLKVTPYPTVPTYLLQPQTKGFHGHRMLSSWPELYQCPPPPLSISEHKTAQHQQLAIYVTTPTNHICDLIETLQFIPNVS